MEKSPKSVLVVGRVPHQFLIEQGYASPETAVDYVAQVLDAQQSSYDAVVADASFDFFGYLDFADTLATLRDLVAEGGTLVYIRRRRPRLRDEFFCYRTDEFFEKEFPAVGAAEFERSSFARWRKWLTVTLEGCVSPSESEARLAALHHSSLGRLPAFSRPLRRPDYIWTAATTRCNIRCHTCSVRSEPDPGVDMTIEMIDRIFGEFQDNLRAVNVTGIGEALFSRHWKQLHAHIRSRPGRLLEIVTNAMLLKEEQVRDMMHPDNPTWLCISIDGATHETFEAIRDRGKWDRLVQAMQMIRRLREELQPSYSHFRLIISFVAIKDNVHELPELFRLCDEWGVDIITVGEMGDWKLNREFFYKQALRFHPRLANEAYAKARESAAQYSFRHVLLPPDYSEEVVARGADEMSLDAGPEETMPLKRRILRKAKRAVQGSAPARNFAGRILEVLDQARHSPASLPRPLALWLQRQIALSNHLDIGRFRRVKSYCEVVDTRTYFHTNGDVVPCCGMLETRFGNLNETPFNDIWNSSSYREFRIMNLLGYPDAPCFFCTLPYGLPSKNPENFIAEHRLEGTRGQRLAEFLRRVRRVLTTAP